MLPKTSKSAALVAVAKASIVAPLCRRFCSANDRLAGRGILYAPDYAINAAGVIAVGYEFFAQTGKNPYSYELNRANMMAHVGKIEKTLDKIFNIADARGITPGRAADELAEAIFRGDAQQEKTSGTA